MKIRQGFVSNSSSSSFILVTTNDLLDDVEKLLTTSSQRRIFNLICGDLSDHKLDNKSVFVSDIMWDSTENPYDDFFRELYYDEKKDDYDWNIRSQYSKAFSQVMDLFKKEGSIVINGYS